MLPPAGSMYNDATCPTDARCYVVGSGPDGGILTTSSDGGSSWTTSTLPFTRGFTVFSMSCPSVARCYVGATNLTTKQSTLIATADGGASWTRQSVPSGVIIASIGCGSVSSVCGGRECR